MGCARRACRVSLNPSTRPSPRAWAWAYLSAARSSKPTADGCGRSRANRRVLSFSLRSLPPERTDRDRLDVALWHETDLPVLSQQVRYKGVNGLALLRSEGPISFFCQCTKKLHPLSNDGSRPTMRSSLRNRSRRNRR